MMSFSWIHKVFRWILVQFGLLSATFWEIAARSVNNLFSLYFVYL